MSTNNEAGGRMTLPKAISDAIDAYRFALWVGDGDEGGESRAALERAIAEHVAPVAAPQPDGFPNDGKLHAVLRGSVEVNGRKFAYTGTVRNWHTLPGDTPPSKGPLYEIEALNLPFRQTWATGIAENVADAEASLCQVLANIMAAEPVAAPMVHGPTGRGFTLREPVWGDEPKDGMPRSVKVYGTGDMGRGEFANYLRADVARQAAATPQQVTAESIKEGFAQIERGEWVTPEQMAKAAAATPAPSALDRLRDKIRSEADNADESYSAGLHRAADMIDEEREREAKHG